MLEPGCGFIGGFFFPRGDPLDPAFTRGEVVKIESKPIRASLLIDFNPPFVASFGVLPSLPLRSNGRLSVHPCTRGAYKGIHALESVATCQLSQPKQMRRLGYLRLIGLNRVCCFVFVIEKVALAVLPPFIQPRIVEDETNGSE